jgi:hypothetical protein
MTHTQRKSLKELSFMSSAQIRDYLQTLSASEQKVVITELYRAMLEEHAQMVGNLNGSHQSDPL